MQIHRVDWLQNKVRDQTKRHTILVDGCMLVATTEKADAYLLCLFFGENDQFTVQLRCTSLYLRRNVHEHWNTADF